MFPWYLHIGMTAGQFWHGDPWLVEAYRQKHNMGIEERNQELWLQGLYFSDAINVALSNALGKKGTKKQKYIEKPIRITPMTEAEKEAAVRRERAKAIEYFNRLKASWDNKNKKRG